MNDQNTSAAESADVPVLPSVERLLDMAIAYGKGDAAAIKPFRDWLALNAHPTRLQTGFDPETICQLLEIVGRDSVGTFQHLATKLRDDVEALDQGGDVAVAVLHRWIDVLHSQRTRQMAGDPFSWWPNWIA